MNTKWKTFLLSQQALVNDESHIAFADTANLNKDSIYPLLHLSALTVSGNDAAKLLQGQITCNINDITENKGSIAAICNPKGRAIATFLLVKKGDGFLLILPTDMLATVQKRLQMFVLRTDVKITDSSDELCLLGVSEPENPSSAFSTEIQNDILFVNMPGKLRRKIVITDADNAIQFWSEQTNSNAYRKAGEAEWRYLDIIGGLPWVTAATSEEFIPQMLNLDKLGGISFNKGCYTGQEIVARTHYLGKSKRELVLAECQMASAPEPMANIINQGSEDLEVVGKVLQVQRSRDGCFMQVVMQRGETAYNSLALQNDGQTPIKVVPFHL